MSEPVRVKRFYKDVAVAPAEGGFAILLDGRPVKTQNGAALIASSEALAEAIAQEWRDQGEHIERRSMPLTGMQSAAIDGAGDCDHWREEIVKYLGSDLVCYRAAEPKALAIRQDETWDPYIDFMRQEFGALMMTTAGIVAISQPDATFSAVRSALKNVEAETLFAIQIATAIAGSAALALALWRGAYAPEEIFEASRVDERFQEEQWGVDDEAKAREDRLRTDFLAIARFLELLVR